MASNGKHSRGNEPKAESAVVESAVAPVEIPAAEAAPAAVAVPVVVAAKAASASETTSFGTAFDASFDSSKLTQKSLDIWSENATALFEFTEKVTKAKSLDEVTELQTRFFTERLDIVLRQSNELLALAQEVMNMTIAPLYSAKAA